LNFASVYYDLLKAKSSGGLTDKTDIQHKLETIPNVYNKIWLAEMLNEIT
jgi:hypothetical protein